MKEVIFNKKKIVKINRKKIYQLKEKALKNYSGKIRLCLHKDTQEALHEMIIVHRKDVYVRPHKHKAKTETFHVIEGSFFIIIFNDKGEITSKILMNNEKNSSNFLCRIDKDMWHMIIPITDFIVLHEITNGPYLGKRNSVFASWAPLDKEIEKVEEFIKKMLVF
jgi:cupin fold WbuC family metalloprotein